MTVETERLLLRDWRETDIDAFDRHTNTPNVMRWLGGVNSRDKLEEIIRTRLMRWQVERGFTFWVVERKADGELLGFCGLKIADTAGAPVEGMVEVGWRLREDAWGQGYAKEAAIASLEHAFETLGAERVVALTCIQNEASWGLMQRLGMTRRPELDYDDPRFPDLNPTIIYDLRPGELIR
ncbi:GNAT family N-acetyltransferase [Allosphingosinicella sp.]|uniref:GNAT family N-acetyltransferase n=1 Tax=Allosphingosinicella sp. TaxID=2823234 RepID=UPI003784A03F